MAKSLYIGKWESLEAVKEALSQPISHLAVDTETINLTSQIAVGIGIQWAPDERLYIQVLPEPSELLPQVMGLIGNPTITKLYFNASFDYRVLYDLADDYGLTPPDYSNIQDASIMAQVQGNSSHALDALSIQYLDYTNEYSIKGLLEEAKREGVRSPTTLDIPIEKLGKKCLNDCWATWNLYEVLSHRWPNERNKECYEVDVKLLPILHRMETKGLRLRRQVVADHYDRLSREIKQYEDECTELGFNPGSSQQVGYILSTRGNILPMTRSRKQLSTDEEALEALDDPLAQTILKYRGIRKLLSTYVEPWRNQERAYTKFRIDLVTGRLASSDRNLQNIPPEMRDIFGPDNKVFSWADYSQIELRVLAGMSHDTVMMEAYRTKEDLHGKTAIAGGVDRPTGKLFNFARIFGASDNMLHRKTGVPEEQIRILRQAWEVLYPDAGRWIKNQQYNHGSYVETDFGRRMALPENITNANPRAFEAHRGKCAVNFPIQGTAADIVKRAMLIVAREGPDLRLQVHDELVVDGEYDFPEPITHIHPTIHTPIKEERGLSWVKS